MSNNLRTQQFIEVVMQWEGEITAKTLQDYFHMSRATAQKLITQYQADFPQNAFLYNASGKCHTPSEDFIPQLTTGSLHEYLSFFGETLTSKENNLAKNSTHLALLPAPIRNVNPTLVRKIIKACRQQTRLDIDYFSLTSGDMEGRIIAPHTIVNDGVRWHLRAYCEKNGDYRDFVLSRFGEDIAEEGESVNTKNQDTEWNTLVCLTLTPDPRLSANKQKAVALDYMMTDNRLEIPVRGALVKYLLQRLRVDSYHPKPEGQQIIVEPECWEKIAPYRMH